MSAILLFLFISPILAGQDGPTYAATFKEGTPGNSPMLVDCLSEKGGVYWGSINGDLKFSAKYKDFPNGTTITAIDVANLKITDQAVIGKTSGGVNSGYVWFKIQSQHGHGAKFQFKIWGRVPANVVAKKRTGNCIS